MSARKHCSRESCESVCVCSADKVIYCPRPVVTRRGEGEWCRGAAHWHISGRDEVHDLPEFLRGGVRDQTTHITVRYRPPRRSSLVKLKPPRHALTTSESSSRSITEEEGEEGNGEPSTYGQATRALVLAAHETASLCSDPPHSLPLPLDPLSPGNLSPRSKEWEGGINNHSPSSVMMNSEPSTPLTFVKHHSMVSALLSPPVWSQSSDVDGGFDSHAHTPVITDLLNRVSGPHLVRSTTPDTLSRARMPRSLSALETYHHSSPLHLDIPTRSKSVLDKPSMGHQPRRSQSLNLTDIPDSGNVEKEIHLYTLSTSTLLFRLLHSIWVCSSLSHTKKPEVGLLLPAHQETTNEHLLEHAFNQLRTELLTASTVETRFTVLQELHHGAKKYSSIRRLMWRDTAVIEVLRSFIKQYMKLPAGSDKCSASESELQERQDELELLMMTLETLSAGLHATQQCPFKMKALKQNKYECLRKLIADTMSTPEVPGTYKLTCERWLTDFRELSSRAWENLPESELLKLVQEVVHASACVLYELFGSLSELTWVCSVQPDAQEFTPNLTAFLQHVAVEGWLAYSVPQLLALLQPEHSGAAASGADAALIHQYCSVLATLLHHSPCALQYCTTVYAEELRYYVQESVVNSRLGQDCLIRPHTVQVVHVIAQLMKSKNSLRTR